MMIRNIAVIVLLTLSAGAYANRDTRESLWLPWFHTQDINADYTFIGDIQVRSDDQQQRAENIIARFGVHRSLGQGFGVSAGYAWNEVRPRGADTRVEHRLWQQGLFTHSLGDNTINHRLRLEQRYLQDAEGDRHYAQRLRYFTRVNHPLGDRTYAALQNEVFLNIENRGRANGRVFDQNRAYVAAGYRLFGRSDIELGYMNQHIQGRDRDITNHIVQLALYTRF